MNAEATTLVAVLGEVRACFHRLKAVADAMHADLGINASMRAVLESLADRGPQTVPEIARGKRVSRQHIQVIVDALAAQGLAVLADNPAHRRSALVAATDRGRWAFAELRRREQPRLAELAAGLSPQALDTTLRTLRALNARLDPSAAKGVAGDAR